MNGPRIYLAPGEGAGSGSTGGSTTPPANPPSTGDQPPSGQQTPPTTGQPAPESPTTTPPSNVQVPPGYVPSESLRAVTAERDRLAREAQERTEAEQTAKGEWEKVAEGRTKERDKAIGERDEWKGKFLSVARRAAFIADIAPQTTDAAAAYKLALVDKFVDDIDVDDDGNANPEKVKAAVKKTLDTYKNLSKPKGFGGDRSGQLPESPGDPSAPMSARERMRRGYESTRT